MFAPAEALQLYVTEVSATLLPLVGKDSVGAAGIAAEGVGVGVMTGGGVGVGVEGGVGVGSGVVTTSSIVQPVILMISASTSQISIILLNFSTFYPCVLLASLAVMSCSKQADNEIIRN